MDFKFQLAVAGNKIDEAEKILKSGYVDINEAIDIYGSVLHLARVCNLVDMTKLLLNYEDMVNIKNHDDDTPLHLAVLLSNFELVRLLLENNADVNITNEAGETALLNACREGYSDIVRILIQFEINVNYVNEDEFSHYY